MQCKNLQHTQNIIFKQLVIPKPRMCSYWFCIERKREVEPVLLCMEKLWSIMTIQMEENYQACIKKRKKFTISHNDIPIVKTTCMKTNPTQANQDIENRWLVSWMG